MFQYEGLIFVFGWNKGQRQGINIGHQNNQNFVQIPTAKLKNRIQQLAEEHGILSSLKLKNLIPQKPRS